MPKSPKKTFPEDFMKYSVDAGAAELIHILRCLMNPWHDPLQPLQVIGRTWEFQSLFAGSYLGEEKLFPENPTQQTPFRLTGERLVERAGLMYDPEETALYRVSQTDLQTFDLAIYVDTGNAKISLNDEELFDYFQSQFHNLKQNSPNFIFHPW